MVTSAGAAYVGVIILLALLENSLVYPSPSHREGDWAPGFAHEDVSFRSRDGTPLHGWLLRSQQPTDLWMIYFHGNADHVAYAAPWLHSLREHLPANIFVFDYRGYGRSDGRPSEAGVLADGEAAMSWLCQHAGLSPGQVALLGRSLGGGVAVHVAAVQGARALILERTFTRLTDAAQSRFWWAPVRWVMRNRFDSIDKIADYRGPLLSSHGTRDTIVPYQQGLQLFEAAGSSDDLKQFVTMEGVGHNDGNSRLYERALVRFLKSLQAP